MYYQQDESTVNEDADTQDVTVADQADAEIDFSMKRKKKKKKPVGDKEDDGQGW